MADLDITTQIAQALAQKTLPSELAKYSELPVKWHKTSPGNAPQMEVRNGICEVYTPDIEMRSSDQGSHGGSIPGVAKLLEACLAQGGLAEGAPDGSKRIGWYQTQNAQDLIKLYGGFLGRPPSFRGVDLRGFVLPEKNGVNVMGTTYPHSAAGHEMKHIFDGDFHQ